ncbi:MAG TPA: DUF2804 domain-containing protein [Anaerolineales bacterium]|nr:DUF2804 domain-containing protein [Anaerolineales bacterium]
MQTELSQTGPLLEPNGQLAQIGWARQPLLDCNLESARFYAFAPLQYFRIKRWDYYAVFSPRRFFSATIADLGYAGNLFVYTMDFETGALHEEGIVVPFAKGVTLARNSDKGDSHFEDARLKLDFQLFPDHRHVSVAWPAFHDGRGIQAEIDLQIPSGYESMNIVIPIGLKRFYYNRKINCLPASGVVKYGDLTETLEPATSLGSLDWGRGVWEYRSFWNWASASGFLPDGRTIGLNLGSGFGDLSRAGENAVILNNRIHKLEQVRFDYTPDDYMKPWKFTDTEKRLELTFTPFKDRLAQTNLGIITSKVHQMFGRYNGSVISDEGEKIHIKDLIGFAEEHYAKW